MSYQRNKDTGFKSALFLDHYNSENHLIDNFDKLSLGRESRLIPTRKSSDCNINEFNLISKDLLNEIEESVESKQRTNLSTLRNSSEVYQSENEEIEKSYAKKDTKSNLYPLSPFPTMNHKFNDDISFYPKSFNLKNNSGVFNPTNTLTRNIPAYMPNISKTPVLDSRSFMYGKIGWVCALCKNFNYEGNYY
jgi:hypothetical protein